MPEGKHDSRVEVHMQCELGDDEEEEGEVSEEEDQAARARRRYEGGQHDEATRGQCHQVGDQAVGCVKHQGEKNQ